MVPVAALTLLLLAGCAKTVTETCSVDSGTVTDDQALDLGGTVVEFVASVGRGLALQDEDGNPVYVDLVATRTADPAALVDKTVEKTTTGFGPNTNVTITFEDGCTDELTAPVAVALTDDAATVDIVAVGTVANDPDTEQELTLDATFDPAASVYPPVADPSPVSGRLLGRLSSGTQDPTFTVWLISADGTQEAVVSTPGIF